MEVLKMTDKFDGKLWKWLLEHVLGKLVPSAADETAGKVLTTDGEDGYEWAAPEGGLPSGGSAHNILAKDEDNAPAWANIYDALLAAAPEEPSSGAVLMCVTDELGNPTLVWQTI